MSQMLSRMLRRCWISGFRKAREKKHPLFSFCQNCKMYDERQPNAKVINPATSRRFRCTAGHTNAYYPNVLKLHRLTHAMRIIQNRVSDLVDASTPVRPCTATTITPVTAPNTIPSLVDLVVYDRISELLPSEAPSDVDPNLDNYTTPLIDGNNDCP
jgi:hypothetical protein